MNDELVEFQFSLSTAEEERVYFSGQEPVPQQQAAQESHLPSGDYRVLNGELYRLVAGSPPLE